jgi:DNA-binding GntR family transcriptional regulator
MRIRVSEVIRREIETDIATGRMSPGERLNEQSLSKRFSVSRTPAREALLALAADGLIVFKSRNGAEVAGLCPQDAIEMVEVLMALEAEAAGLAARRMTDKERIALRDLHLRAEAAVRAGDVSAYGKGNADFHAAIYAGARNKYLAREITARLRTRLFRQMSISRRTSLHASWTEHTEIAEAIIAGDEQAAREAMRTHISAGGTLFADMVSALTSADVATTGGEL